MLPSRLWFFIVLLISLVLIIMPNSSRADDGETAKVTMSGGVVGGDTPTPDLFTGTASFSIPIEVPAGRKEMDPGLALNYRSGLQNSWLGVGWDLEVGSIQRNLKNLDYGSDNYQLKIGGATADIISIGEGEYRYKIEGEFLRIQRVTSPAPAGEPYWIVTNKSGIRYFFGRTSASRQDNPDKQGDTKNIQNIFKWCLDRVEDLNGNYISITYNKNPGNSGYKGEIYLSQIAYTSHESLPSAPINVVNFYLEQRPDAPDNYQTNFLVKTSHRLKTIDIMTVVANGTKIRYSAYGLEYEDSSSSTSSTRSTLKKIKKYDRTAQVDSLGSITGGLFIPISTMEYTTPKAFFAPETTLGRMGWDDLNRYMPGDFDGDGKTDLLFAYDGNIDVWTATSGTRTWAHNFGWNDDTKPRYRVGDFNGDGKADLLHIGSGATLHVRLSNGNGFDAEAPSPWGQLGWEDFTKFFIGDFNGDGKTDVLFISDGKLHVSLSLGDHFAPGEEWGSMGWNNPGHYKIGDFNGDGKMDVLFIDDSGHLFVALANPNGKGFLENKPWGQMGWNDMARYSLGDFNGDGKTDVVFTYNARILVLISKGDSFAAEQQWGDLMGWDDPTRYRYADFDGDGKTDICLLHNGQMYLRLSNGTGTLGETTWDTKMGWDDLRRYIIGDFNGDGKNEFLFLMSGTLVSKLSAEPVGNYLKQITGEKAGTTTLAYASSTNQPNLRLPFPVQVLKTISVNDGVNTSTTSFDYQGGFYHLKERDFRGFNYVKKTDPSGPDNGRMITEIWFHQGNDKDVVEKGASESDETFQSRLVGLANVPDGYLKGKPYRNKISGTYDGQTLLTYSEEETTYKDQAIPISFYAPMLRKDVFSCGGGVAGSCKESAKLRHMQTVYGFDNYGNVVLEEQHGDVSDPSDDRTISRTFVEETNSGQWIVGFLSSETVFPGIGTASDPVSSTSYDYFGSTDCTSYRIVSGTKGLLAKVRKTLRGGTDPETWIGYDEYGNQTCTRDPNGNITKVGYDESYSYPVVKTMPTLTGKQVGFKVSTEYYGIGSSTIDGLYGQVKRVSQPHGEEASYPWTTYMYDSFGRKVKEIRPDGAWTSSSYNNFGTINLQALSTSQNVRVESSEGPWTVDYFDGLGRSVKKLRSGPDNKTIGEDTEYDKRGLTIRKSMPYFIGDTPAYTQMVYDVLGRTVATLSPDPQTRVLTCYDEGVAVTIDSNNHRKRQTKDTNGRLVKVEEYRGGYASCTTEPLTPYATTTYRYDLLGNLTDVYDAKQNHTIVAYDTLGRKKSMSDPDMGAWVYGYDGNGNLTSQQDAKQNIIQFQYDEMNRVRFKLYPDTTRIIFNYDESTSAYPVGRLTSLQDASGYKKYDYDIAGRVAKTTKTVDGQSYAISTEYDGLDRLKTVAYPGQGNEVVTTVYDLGGNISTVTGRTYDNNHNFTGATVYGTYSGYNAKGQQGKVTFGNNVITDYQYDTANLNKWLSSITTTLPGTNQKVVDLLYDYYSNRNLKSVTDKLNQQPLPDIVARDYTVYPGKAHACMAVGSATKFDNNGNFESDSERTASFNFDNMPTEVNTIWGSAQFVYDGNGIRVKKTSQGQVTTYIDKFYECRTVAGVGTCGKYIFAGPVRLALKNDSGTFYYHTDHLQSTVAVTDKNGLKADSVAYSAFGETKETPVPPNTGFIHKFTGQEHDGETGLYNYGARLYDPDMGRFISPDAFVPEPGNPQSLNRYSYVYNNPLNYVDPSGFWRFSLSLHAIVGFDVSYDFDNGHFRGGVGFGADAGFSVGDKNWDIGASSGYYVDYGYDNKARSDYVTAKYGQGVTGPTGQSLGGWGASGTYYPRLGEYQASAGVGYGGVVGVNVGYSSFGNGSWSVGGSFLQAGAAYDFGTNRWGYSYTLDLKAMQDAYENGVKSREFNGYGPEGGGGFYKIVDWVGTVMAGYQAADGHDAGYGRQGANKAAVDFGFFKNMIGGSLSNLTQSNGLLRATIGLTISPIYYTAVAAGGGPAFKAAQARYAY